MRVFLLLLLWCLVLPLRAQQQPEVGVVYQPAATLDDRQLDFVQMEAAGIKAVRTPPLDDDRLLTLADTLGLTLYQELPVAYLTGGDVAERRDEIAALLTDVLTRARTHPSARTIGLARMPDTADPRVCALLRDLAGQARAQLRNVRLYYVAPFIEQDGCAGAVDFVLLPQLGEAHPEKALARWRAAHPQTPAGVVVGWPLHPEVEGLRAALSPERAAARLDTLLARLLGSAQPLRPAAVLVYRWHDGEDRTPDLAPSGHTAYGLLDGAHVRPAYDVVRGYFGGTRNVYALKGGTAPARGRADGLVLLTWAMVGLLGWTMRREPRLRQMAQRYFSARGFYRESVREARDALGLTTLVLTLVIGMSVGVIGAAVLEMLRTTPAFGYLVASLPAEGLRIVEGLLETPVVLALALAAAFVLAQAVQALGYALAVRRRYMLRPIQAMALALWSRWPMIPLAFAALVVHTFSAPWAWRGVLLVGALALLVEGWALLRTLVDLAALTRVPVVLAFALVFTHPLVLGAAVLGLTLLDYGSAYAYFLRLARYGLG